MKRSIPMRIPIITMSTHPESILFIRNTLSAIAGDQIHPTTASHSRLTRRISVTIRKERNFFII